MRQTATKTDRKDNQAREAEKAQANTPAKNYAVSFTAIKNIRTTAVSVSWRRAFAKQYHHKNHNRTQNLQLAWQDLVINLRPAKNKIEKNRQHSTKHYDGYNAATIGRPRTSPGKEIATTADCFAAALRLFAATGLDILTSDFTNVHGLRKRSDRIIDSKGWDCRVGLGPGLIDRSFWPGQS